jgi:hypothetical protein
MASYASSYTTNHYICVVMFALYLAQYIHETYKEFSYKPNGNDASLLLRGLLLSGVVMADLPKRTRDKETTKMWPPHFSLSSYIFRFK